MPIQTKDGVYSLTKPNPIMKGQDFWEDGIKYILHNFDYREDALSMPEEKPELPEPKFERLEDIQPQELIVPIKETPIEKKKKKPRGIMVYCMPAIVTEVDDLLYNDKRMSINYGTQFTFEVITKQQTDAVAKLWTTREITKFSIIYVPQEYRWWKVEGVRQEDGGYLLDCLPSSLQPSFSPPRS